MIESVAVRQQGAYDFETHYNNLCALQSSCPSQAVKAHLSEGVLDINGDRIRVTDWVPILNSIRINKTLTFVAIRSYFHSQDDDDKRVGVRKKTPAIRSKEITYRLCKSLKECLAVTPTLTCIELQGLPLRERDLATLSKGLTANATLTHLSLEYSNIGDDGLDVICKGVKNSPSVTSLNFTGCGLSWKGAGVLATVIKHQAMKRHNEAWQDSLRYRRPDLDRMSGIRRITVNSNPLMAEKGAQALAEALKDDLWLKALDMQQCGMNNAGAQALLDVLKYNTTIVVLDVRQNPLIDQDIIRSIMEQVMINCNGQDTEYKWIRAEGQGSGKAGKARKKRTKMLQSSFGKKTTIKVTTSNPRRRSKSATSVGRTGSSEAVKLGPGMPWRTALRADRYRGYQEHHEAGQLNVYERMSGSSSPESPSHPSGGATYTDHDTTGGASDSEYQATKQGMVELEQLRRRFREESIARSRADAQVLELQVENQRLRHQVAVLQAGSGGGGGAGLLDDDRVLDNIEKSFQQFHAFLDMLQEAGLGQLITLAGLDQSRMPFNRSDLEAARAPYGSLPHHQGTPPVTAPQGAPSAAQPSGAQSQNYAPHAGNQQPKVSLVPDNRRHGDDPTLRGPVDGAGNGVKGSNTRFDDLYAKVLQETDGAISTAQADAQSQSVATRGPQGSGNGSGSSSKGPVSAGSQEERRRGGGDSDLSDHSAPRSTSQRQSQSQRSRPSSRSAPRPLQSSNSNHANSQGSQGSKAASGPQPVGKSQHSEVIEYSQDFERTQSDISEDIENIHDINDLLPAASSTGLHGAASDDDSF